MSERIERAKKFYSDNVEPGDQRGLSDWMADFAQSEVRAERERIVREIEENIGRYKTPRAQMLSLRANVLDKLRGGK